MDAHTLSPGSGTPCVPFVGTEEMQMRACMRAELGIQLYWTVKVVLPLIVPGVAVIVVLPGARAVAKPVLLIVATVVLLEAQVAEFVMSLVVPFENVAVAVNCCV